MSWIAVAIGGGALIGGIASVIGSENAADTQEEAAQNAQDWQERVYWQNRKDLAPWREQGGEALNTLTGMLKAGPGEYEKSPYYNFLMGQGTQALERGAAARGNQLSGAENKALTQFGQGLASTDYDTWLNNWYKSLTPYQSLAGLGQTTATQGAGLANQSANAIGQYGLAGGEARAAGQLGVANTIGNYAQWGGQQAGNYLMQNALNQNYGQPMYNPQTYWPQNQINSMGWL